MAKNREVSQSLAIVGRSVLWILKVLLTDRFATATASSPLLYNLVRKDLAWPVLVNRKVSLLGNWRELPMNLQIDDVFGTPTLKEHCSTLLHFVVHCGTWPRLSLSAPPFLWLDFDLHLWLLLGILQSTPKDFVFPGSEQVCSASKPYHAPNRSCHALTC